jgi:RNA polymerase sigma-70 factor (ECF subfamily)
MLAMAAPSSAAPPAARADRADLDALTLRRAQKGDARACRALVERHQHAVFAVVGRVMGHGPHVEDVAQEVFLRVFRALPGFDPAGPATLSTWVLTIAWRLAVDEARRRRLPLTALEDAHAVASELRADASVDQQEMHARIHRALAALTPEQRATLVLFEFHDLGHQDIAAVTRVDVGTVKSRLSRARAAMRTLLGGGP